MVELDELFLKKIIFSDECCFSLNGQVNRQNVRFWGTERPTFSSTIVQYTQSASKVNVWVGMSSDFVIGPYFFEENGVTVNINSERYYKMLQDYLFVQLQSNRYAHYYFQQDGAPSHVSVSVKQALKDFFHTRIISRGFTNEWPACSPDLSPLDFWLWSYIKEKVYLIGDMPRTIEELKIRIVNAISNIPTVFYALLLLLLKHDVYDV